jgi:hypothetical protein
MRVFRAKASGSAGAGDEVGASAAATNLVSKSKSVPRLKQD